MRRIGVVVLGLIVLAIFGNSIEATGENTNDNAMCVPMGNILLKAPDSIQANKSPVDFPHSRHFSLECRACHHQWEGDSPIQTCTTSGCHDLSALPEKSDSAKKDTGLGFRYYKNAFHKMCIGCHKKMKLENKKKEMSLAILKTRLPNTGPTSCMGCHPKQ